MASMKYLCAVCGEVHTDLPDIGFAWPDHYFDVPENEREARIEGTSDACSVDKEHCFVRGAILIPIKNEDRSFGLGVWVSLKPENYEAYLANLDSSDIGPFFGWLCNTIPFYDDETQLMKAMVHFQGNGQRPLIELAACEHPLYSDYAEGITLERAFEYVHWYQQ
jgi:hypothetical protein